MQAGFTGIERNTPPTVQHCSSLHLKSLRSGFTLIEVLTVAFIIIILATISFRVAKYAVLKSKYSRCEGELSRFASAAENMRATSGSYLANVFGTEGATDLPQQDPWGSKYGYIAIDIERASNVCYIGGNYSPTPRCSAQNVTLSRMYQEFAVFSRGPDTAPGVRLLNDDSYSGTDYYNNGWPDLGEIGYGDDVVLGNTTVKRGFGMPLP